MTADELKIVVLSAPSGSGKTTIARALMDQIPALQFSISATTRQPRGTERDGVDYHFLALDTFRSKVAADEFIEWEEVYPGLLYGTLRSEIARIGATGVPLLDIDVKGAINVKRQYGNHALTIFLRPPSFAILAERLQARGTETEDAVSKRLERARLEMTYAAEFDAIIINDDLDIAIDETVRVVNQFLAASSNSAA